MRSLSNFLTSKKDFYMFPQHPSLFYFTLEFFYQEVHFTVQIKFLVPEGRLSHQKFIRKQFRDQVFISVLLNLGTNTSLQDIHKYINFLRYLFEDKFVISSVEPLRNSANDDLIETDRKCSSQRFKTSKQAKRQLRKSADLS